MTHEQSAELDAISAQFNDRDYDELEAQLRLKAAVLGWTGDPLQQPVESVLAIARSIAAKNLKSDELRKLER